MKPERIVVSPGPSTPLNAGVSNAVIRHFTGRLPLLGVCLGHQCIGHVFGGLIRQAGRIMHGKSSAVYHDGLGVFEGIPNPFSAIRYHSLVVDPENLPACLMVTARTDDGAIMGLRHRHFPVEGVQFHPESFMTEYGRQLLENFLRIPVGGVNHD